MLTKKGQVLLAPQDGALTSVSINMKRTRQFVLKFQYHWLWCRYEFGGPWGVVSMMIGFPLLMYYLWICLWFYDGQLVFPKSLDGVQPFLQQMWTHVKQVWSTHSRASVLRSDVISGCVPYAICVCHVWFFNGLSTASRVYHAWLSTRRSPGPVIGLQDSDV